MLLGEGEVPAKETGRVLPRRSANFLVEVQLGTVQQSSGRRGARRPYCSLSGTLFLLGTSSPHCQLHFLFLCSWLRAGRVCGPKQTTMHSEPNEKKPRKSKAKANGALCASEPSQLPPNRSSGQQIPSGLSFQGQIDRPKSSKPVDEGGRERGRRPSTSVPCGARTGRTASAVPCCAPAAALSAALTLRRSLPPHSTVSQSTRATSELLKQHKLSSSMERWPCSRAPSAGELRNRNAPACSLCIYSWWEG